MRATFHTASSVSVLDSNDGMRERYLCGGKGGRGSGLCLHLNIAQLNVCGGRLRVESDGESY